jgi:hypothetical protein
MTNDHHRQLSMASSMEENNATVSQLLNKLAANSRASSHISIKQIKLMMHEQGFCLLMIMFAIPCILPIPGISVIAGIPLIFFATQMLMGFDSPWLPKWVCNKNIDTANLEKIINKSTPYLQKIEFFSKPRFLIFSTKMGEKLVGLISLIFAIYITLPVIFGNTLPSLGITVMSLGLLNRDGIMIIFGTITGVLGVLLASMVIVTGIGTVKILLNNALGFL